jgi:hypothetical protein
LRAHFGGAVRGIAESTQDRYSSLTNSFVII